MEILTFDIETIPQRKPLAFAQKEELEKRLKRFYWNKERTTEDEEATKRMLMATKSQKNGACTATTQRS